MKKKSNHLKDLVHTVIAFRKVFQTPFRLYKNLNQKYLKHNLKALLNLRIRIDLFY